MTGKKKTKACSEGSGSHTKMSRKWNNNDPFQVNFRAVCSKGGNRAVKWGFGFQYAVFEPMKSTRIENACLRVGLMLAVIGGALLFVADIRAEDHSQDRAQDHTFLWVRQAGGADAKGTNEVVSQGNYPSAFALDHEGNSLMVGYFDSLNPGFVGPKDTHFATKGSFFAKYNPEGNLLWVLSPGTNAGYWGVGADAGGNVYISGYTNVSYSSNHMAPSNVLLTKYGPLGNVIWSVQSKGNRVDDGVQLAVDAATNIYLRGFFTSSNITFGDITLTNSSTSSLMNFDSFLVKFDASGQALWARRISGINEWCCQGIKPEFDPVGNVVFAAPLRRSAGFDSTVVSNSSQGDLCLAKYSASGKLLWAKDVAAGNFFAPLSLAVDYKGDQILSGYYMDEKATFGGITLTRGKGNFQNFIAKFDINGLVVWATQAMEKESGDLSSCGVFADAVGCIYQTGIYHSKEMDFGGLILSNPNEKGQSTYVAKYDANGKILWAVNLSGLKSSSPEAFGGFANINAGYIEGDSQGNIFLAGIFSEPGGRFGETTVPTENSRQVFLAKLDGRQ
jgi:hypothetical protein